MSRARQKIIEAVESRGYTVHDRYRYGFVKGDV